MAQQQSQSGSRTQVGLDEPHQWAVTLWNDDFTTMDFVVQVLVDVFLKSEADALHLMLTVHKSGHAVVGAYTYDVAVSRTQMATTMAREAGFPLKITYQEV